MTQRTAAALRCSNGEHCVAYPTLGEPSKLSSGNPGPRCFACDERRAASELERAAPKPKVPGRHEASGPLHHEDDESRVRTCA